MKQTQINIIVTTLVMVGLAGGACEPGGGATAPRTTPDMDSLSDPGSTPATEGEEPLTEEDAIPTEVSPVEGTDPPSVPDPVPDVEACAPACESVQCGDDGCGGSCGECADAQHICEGGACECVPDCSGKLCGADGCGGGCGECAEGESCDPDGQCVWTPADGTYSGPSGLKIVRAGGTMYFMGSAFSCKGGGAGYKCEMTNKLTIPNCQKAADYGFSKAISGTTFSMDIYGDHLSGVWVSATTIEGKYFVTGDCCSASVPFVATWKGADTTGCL